MVKRASNFQKFLDQTVATASPEELARDRQRFDAVLEELRANFAATTEGKAPTADTERDYLICAAVTAVLYVTIYDLMDDGMDVATAAGMTC